MLDGGSVPTNLALDSADFLDRTTLHAHCDAPLEQQGRDIIVPRLERERGGGEGGK